MLITKNSRLLQIIAFYDFVYLVSVVSRQFIWLVSVSLSDPSLVTLTFDFFDGRLKDAYVSCEI